jgi:hypothetical protein
VDFNLVQTFFLNAGGMAHEFRFKDHADFSAVNEQIDLSRGGPVYQLSKAYWLSADPPGVDIVSLGNFSVSGVIGGGAATVDTASLIKINQTTVGVQLSLPNPTDTTGGRMVQIANYGVVPFTMLGLQVEPRTARNALWDGAAWAFTAEVVPLYVVYRKIKKPVKGTVTVYLNGLPLTIINASLLAANALGLGVGYDLGNVQLANEAVTDTGVSAALNYESGELIWLASQRPRPGFDVLTASFEFDLPARFNSDRMPTTFATFKGYQNSFQVIEQTSPDDWLNFQPQSYNNPTPVLVDLTFSGGANLTNTGTTWSNVSGGDGYGLGDLKLAAGSNGWIQFTYAASDAGNAVLGFNAQNIADKYTGGVGGSNGYEYGAHVFGSLIEAIVNGVSTSANVGNNGVNVGDIIRIRRSAGALFVEKSVDNGVNWLPVHNFAASNNNDLYPNLNLVHSTSKCYAPKIT